MKISLLFAVALSVATTAAVAQGSPLTDGPANAEVGKCYAKCYIGNEYKDVTEQVLVKPAHKKMTVIPAVYETTTEKVMIKEASTKMVPVAAVYESTTEKVMVKEASKKLVPKAANYESKTERVMVSEPTTRWVKKNDPNCIAEDPKDCMVVCLEEVPAQYKTVTSSVVSNAASVDEIAVPAEYITLTKRVIKTPATTKEVDVPAEYKTVTKRVLKSPASVTETDVAAEFNTVTKKELVKAGSYTDWREVLCDTKVTTQKIRQIQSALMAKGYDVGAAGADNVMGKATRDALTQYQKDNKLPVGNLNIETLKSLGVE